MSKHGGDESSMKNLIYIAHGNYNVLSRAKKQINSLLSCNYQVALINGLFGDDFHYDYGFPIKKIEIGVSQIRIVNFLHVLIYSIKVLFVARKINPEVIICRELTNLPAGVLLKIFLHIRLVYDSNELSVETRQGVSKGIWKEIEKRCLHYCDEIIHANEERREVFLKQYSAHTLPHNNHVIENFPIYKEEIFARDNSDLIKAVYFGIIEYHRGLDELVLSVKNIDNLQLDIIGFGGEQYIKHIKRMISENNIRNVRILGPIDDGVAGEEFHKYKIGVALYPDVNLNNWLCAPNKIWQYLHAKLAILATKNPPIQREVNRYGFGVCIDSICEDDISAAIREILSKRMWEQITDDVIIEHSWQSIQPKFLKIIQGK